MRRANLYFCMIVLFSLVMVSPAIAQKPQNPQNPQNRSTTPSPTGPPIRYGSIDVHVFSASGGIFTDKPNVTLTKGGFGNSLGMSVPEKIGRNEWKFGGLEVGAAYEVVVEAKGYEPQRQYVIVEANNKARIDVYMVAKEKAGDTSARPAGHFLLSPRAQHEVDKAIKDLNSSKNSAAREHLEKALAMAPGHPGVNYLMGLSYLRDHETDKGLPYLEKSLSIDPSQLMTRLALATVRHQQRNYSAAIDLLKDAPGKGPGAWEAQWILASSYLHVKNYEEARRHAEESLKADMKKARGVRLVLGEALAGLGRRQEAIKELRTFLEENSHDPQEAKVRALIEELRKPAPPPEPPAGRSKPGAVGGPAESDDTNNGATFHSVASAYSRTLPPALAHVAPPPFHSRQRGLFPSEPDEIRDFAVGE